MDILSARKKAAERAGKKEKKKAPVEDAARTPVEAAVQPSGEESAPVVTPGGVTEPAPQAAQEESEAGPVLVTGEEAGEPLAQEIEMLAFRLGGEEYAVMVEQVREVLKMREITPVPHAPEYVLGVTSLRGAVLPVIDLCKRLGIPSGHRDEKSRIVVVSLEDEETGLLVDRVTGVVRLSPDTVKPAPETIEQGRGAEYLRGIARKDDKLYILLDIEKAVGG